MAVSTDIHERIRAMEAVDAVQGLTELAPDRIQRQAVNWVDPIRAGVSYFRVPDTRMPRGKIALLPNGQNAAERVMYRDYVLLRQYGGYHGANQPADWQMADKYLGIIQRGGIHEFDAVQIVDLFWHYRARSNDPTSHRLLWAEIDRLIAQGIPEEDAVLTVMPQLEGVDRTVATCEKCGDDRRLRDADSVRLHRAIMHPDDVQTIGTREAITQALQGGGGDMNKLADAMAALVEQNRMLMELLAGQAGTARRGRPPKPTDDDTE